MPVSTRHREIIADRNYMTIIADALGSAFEENAALKDVTGKFRTAQSFASYEMMSRWAQEGVSNDAIITMLDRAATAAIRLAMACDSPIEREMCAPLLMANYQGYATCPPAVHLPKEEERLPKGDVIIIPQMAILKYRLDFGIIGLHEDQSVIVGLECDGAEFHTDKQKDWKKTKYLESAGIRLVRVTGADIKADPVAVARKVAVILSDWKATR